MEENREKTYVEDIDRSVYDIKNDEKDAYRLQEGAYARHCGAAFQRKKGSALDGAFPASIFADLQRYEGAGTGGPPWKG